MLCNHMIHDIFTLDRDESRFKHIIEIIGMIFCLTTEILFNYNLLKILFN